VDDPVETEKDEKAEAVHHVRPGLPG
jgi:hypothetical protein